MRLTGSLFSYASGLLAAPYLYRPLALPVLIVLAGGAWVVLSWCPQPHRGPGRIALCSLVICLFCVGLFQYELYISPPDDKAAIHNLSDMGPVNLEGFIKAVNIRYPNGVACKIAVTYSIDHMQKTERNGTILLYIEQFEDMLSPGDRIRFRTSLRKPRPFGTPGEFDSMRYLAHQSVFATGFIKSSRDIARLETESSLLSGSTLLSWRQRTGAIIDASVPEHLAPYLHGLATGDRGALSPDQRQLLARSGIAHLFAISGLHLGVIASILYILLRQGYRHVPLLLHAMPPRRILPFVILPVVAAYMIFTGSAISTLRALLGLVAVTIAFVLRRQVSPLQLLATAALIILIIDPLALFSPAFQLSFSGAAGILCITPGWTTINQDWPRIIAYPATLFIVTCSATIATLPLVLMHFHLAAPTGLILNILAVPTVTLLAVPLCLAGVASSPFWPELSALLFNLAASLLESLLYLSEAMLRIPGFSGTPFYLPPLALFGTGLLALAFLTPTPPRYRIVGIAVALVCLFSPLVFTHDAALKLVSISVGQGDAALVTTSSGKTILVDGGGFSQSDFDTGERLVAPTLGYFGVRTIDAVVLTHNHPDHRNGLMHVIRTFNVRSFWSPVNIEELPEEMRSLLIDRHIPIRTFPENWSIIEQAHQSKIAVYRVPGQPESMNNQSLVLYFKNGNAGLLMTGDLETEGINKLALDPPPGPVSLLKTPHHGSRFSNPQSLLNLFDPEIVYISVGSNNRYGQPHTSILSMFENYPLRVERTDLSGTLLFSTRGESWTTRRWDKRLFR